MQASVVVPVGPDLVADVRRLRGDRMATPSSSRLGAGYPYGLVDPIRELGVVARDRGVGLHVDACLGAFAPSPSLSAAGVPVPPFDFSVDGVTSISADLRGTATGRRARRPSTTPTANYDAHSSQSTPTGPGRIGLVRTCSAPPGLAARSLLHGLPCTTSALRDIAGCSPAHGHDGPAPRRHP